MRMKIAFGQTTNNASIWAARKKLGGKGFDWAGEFGHLSLLEVFPHNRFCLHWVKYEWHCTASCSHKLARN